MTFEEMLEAQRQLQIKAYGKDPAELEGDERVQFIKDMTLALTDELHEVLNEVNWKPWAKGNDVNEAAYQGEIVDAFHFFMNLMLVGHMSVEELAKKYAAKRQKNIKRQKEGYDGKNKCPGCGRALDDDAVECRWEPNVNLFWCDKLKQYKWTSGGAKGNCSHPNKTRVSRQFVQCTDCQAKIQKWAFVSAQYEATVSMNEALDITKQQVLSMILNRMGLDDVRTIVTGDRGKSSLLTVRCQYNVRGNWNRDIELKIQHALMEMGHKEYEVHSILLTDLTNKNWEEEPV